MATQEELIQLFGDDFGAVLSGLAQLPPEARELLETTMGRMLNDANVFTSRISKAVQTQTSGGIATAATQGVLTADMATAGAIFGELRNTIKESIVEGINQTGRAGSFEAYEVEPDTLFTWVTVAGHKICEQCSGRTGQRLTLDEWEQIGMPGTGWSVCKGHCYCVLDPTGKIDPLIELEKRRADVKKASLPSEKNYIKEYNLSSDEVSQYKRFIKLDSSTSMEMLKRKSINREIAYREMTKAREKLIRAEQSILKHSVNGKFTEKRRKLHKQLARKITNKGAIAKQGQQEFLTTGGYPGSGKSTILNEAFPNWENKFVHIDSDAIKEMLAKHDGIDKLGWRAYIYHKESDFVIDEIFKLALKENRNILFDGTMKSKTKIRSFISQFKELGYKSTTAFADLPLEQSMERAIARFFGKSGRFVDPIYIITHGNQNINTFNSLKDLVDAWMQWNTNVPLGAKAYMINSSP